MPIRLLNSPVLKWPDAETVWQAVRDWTEDLVRQHPEIVRVGLFGSYARGDWGVGSDIDAVIIVRETLVPFVERARQFDTYPLPLSTGLLVYTEAEWPKMLLEGRFAPAIEREAIWAYPCTARKSDL